MHHRLRNPSSHKMRASSFSISLEKEKEFIKNSSRDTPAVNAKDQAWGRIHTGFNSRSGALIPRSNKDLKKKWDNLVTKAKKETTTFNVNQVITGGGPGGSPIPVVYHATSASDSGGQLEATEQS